MFAKRIIPCLDCKDGRVVKGTRFLNLRDAGNPEELSAAYNREGADELVMLDISASREGRATLLETVQAVARRLFIPLTVGGGVRAFEDGRRLLAAGADKIAINTAAVEAPQVLSDLAARFGSQAVVVAIDARRVKSESSSMPQKKKDSSSGGNAPNANGITDARPRWEVVTYGGARGTGLDALQWAAEAEQRGAGEILLTSMDADGTREGFDCELTAAIATSVHIPVIASGGAGKPEDFADVFLRGSADAALAASIFHFGEYSILGLKHFLRDRGVPVRI